MDQMQHNLNLKCIGTQVYRYDSVTSTNDVLLKLIQESPKDIFEGAVVLAEEQTAGRGRLNKPLKSPKNMGVWMSIYLEPGFLELSKAFLITFGAAAAVAQVVHNVFRLHPHIKWPNDVLLNGKKFCGILTETKSENNFLVHAVLGIGINVNQQQKDFNGDESINATSLRMEFGQKIDKMKLFKKLIEGLDTNYSLLKSKKFSSILMSWKKYATFLGQQVTVVNGKNSKVGIAKGIDENGGIVLECNGNAQVFYNGSLVL